MMHGFGIGGAHPADSHAKSRRDIGMLSDEPFSRLTLARQNAASGAARL
jgi:hypothetical protein